MGARRPLVSCGTSRDVQGEYNQVFCFYLKPVTVDDQTKSVIRKIAAKQSGMRALLRKYTLSVENQFPLYSHL